jgi:hypothetical protein
MDSDKEKEHHGDATEGEEGVKQQRAHEGDLFNSKRWKKKAVLLTSVPDP